jgi:MFS family permease
MRLLPRGLPAHVWLIIAGRGLRAFGDGFVSLLLPVYLTALGFDGFQVGVLTTATLLGSAALTLGVGFLAQALGRRALLVTATLMMIGTGLGFMLETQYWPLVAIGFIGTLNPSSGDVSLFLPLEHACLAEAAPDRSRTAVFAFYSLSGAIIGAFGALAAGLPQLLRASLPGLSLIAALQAMFALYALLGLASYFLYRRLPAALDARHDVKHVPLGPSRRRVFTFAALFSLDAFAGGLTIQSLMALWLIEHFGMSLAAAGTLFFWVGVLNAISYPVSIVIARRIGLVVTMVAAHLPANLCLIALAFAPDLETAIVFIMMRAALQQMDVAARSSYVMAMVTPAERPAAASVTLVPRSLATAAGPLLAGYLLGASAFGVALVVGGALKVVYDLLLLALFRRHKPPEERV